jgi:hypothetical protein
MGLFWQKPNPFWRKWQFWVSIVAVPALGVLILVLALVGGGGSQFSVPDDETIRDNIERAAAERERNRSWLTNVQAIVEECSPQGTKGTATNNNDFDYGFVISGHFFDTDGNPSGFISGSVVAEAGQTVEWSVTPDHPAPASTRDREKLAAAASCRIRISNPNAGPSADDVLYEGPVHASR